ncbi:MAG: aminomethyl transferase family protein [Chloroflexi bacterium]|nr:aminomethyl transferase family protein [Chloroflexota bacterium]
MPWTLRWGVEVEATMEWMYYRYPQAGTLRLGGKDRKVFLQQLTTNDIEALSPDQAVFTVLTNAAGRVLDWLLVLEEGEYLLVLTLPGRGETTFAYLQSQREEPPLGTVPLASLRRVTPRFQVEVRDESRLWDQAVLLPGEGPPPGGLDAPQHVGHVQRFANGSAAVSLPQALGGGLLVLTPRGVTVMVVARAVLLDTQAFDVERVRRGILGPETELTAEFSPLELGLKDFVAFDKDAAFPGRAVLATEARQTERGRQLVGLRLHAPITLPASVRMGETQIGPVTSAVTTPEGPLALAVVRRPYHQPGTQVSVHYAEGEHERTVPAEVSALPLA